MVKNQRRQFANQQTEQYGMNPSAGMYQDVADVDTGLFQSLTALRKEKDNTLQALDDQLMEGEISHIPTSGFEDFIGGALPSMAIGTQISKLVTGFGAGNATGGDENTTALTDDKRKEIQALLDKSRGVLPTTTSEGFCREISAIRLMVSIDTTR